MNDKELYKQKKQAQLDEWKAQIDQFKAKASGASADVQLEMNKYIRMLEGKIEDGKSRLIELTKTGENAFDSMKENVESAWDSLKVSFNEAIAKFKS